ncbi:GrpE protein [Coriobacterium glomerans PW2]|uniref:Protein GrpE n=1 Tax=Coriobacterium glomerans (strain ATCC 49209 / DSM 20642 / JCM 10262 / PW2) TaxID=700015 RepID=F2NA09_CORGP|nr:nucleotide exchange factor GrpE [Coriobacterium glomerans]AEB06264.1 GrpE protein [Coriobacterium glomerans PW2]
MAIRDVQAGAASAPDGAEEREVKIPVEAAGGQADKPETDPTTGEAPARAEADSMTEEEMVEAAIQAGEDAAENDFKFKYERARSELADAHKEIDACKTAQKEAEDQAREAKERMARLQADWENYRRRTAAERLSERERATEKLICALLPVLDDMERAIEHARAQENSETGKQLTDGVDAVHTKMLDVLAHEGVEAIDPKGEAFDPLEHQAVGRVEDKDLFDETVKDVYQKGYRIGGRSLRPAMVTVTYGGEKRPAPESEKSEKDELKDDSESSEPKKK